MLRDSPELAPSGRRTDEVTRLWGEDVRGISRPNRPASAIECREAHPALHNQRVAASGDDMPEPHPANRVRRQPGLHPHVDSNPIQLDPFRERKV